MKMTMKKITLILLASVLVLTPFLVGYAQRDANMKKNGNVKLSRQNKAREALGNSVAGNLILNAVATESSDWLLDDANFSPRLNEIRPANTNVSFDNDGQKLIVSIIEFDTAETAAKKFHLPRSAGKSQAMENFGDEGEKIFNQSGKFTALRYRQGNIITSIFTIDEKAAEQFAESISQAISSIALKNPE